MKSKPKGINPYTIRLMEEISLNLNAQTSKSVSKYLGKVHFAYLITVCRHAEENYPVWFGKGQWIHIDFPDPSKAEGSDDEIMQVFHTERDDIQTKIINSLNSFRS